MPEPRLLDQVRDRLRVRHYSMRTEDAYCIQKVVMCSAVSSPLIAKDTSWRYST